MKDELERQLPYLKKEFFYAKDFAGKSVQQIWKKKLADATVLNAQTLQTMIFINNGKGAFDAKVLPTPMQFAPVFGFAGLSMGRDFNLLYAGNFFGVVPYEGIYDALVPAFYNEASGTITNTPLLNSIRGEVRDIKLIQLANKKKGILIAKNNDELQLLQY